MSMLVILAIGIFLVYYFLLNKHESDNYPGNKTIKYSFTLKNPTNQFINTTSLWVYLPRERTAFQKRVKTNFSQPAIIIKDSANNEKAVFTAHNIPPFGSAVLSVSAELNFANNPNRTSGFDRSTYLRAGHNVESDDPRIMSIANTLKAETMYGTTENIYKWILNNLSDAGYVERDHGALYALDHKTGDCTEFMNLFLALARASGIPSRGVAGYISGESAILLPRNFHNWVEVYINSAWRVVDPINKVIFKNESFYIPMRYLAGSGSDETGNTQRFFDSDDAVQVSMNE